MKVKTLIKKLLNYDPNAKVELSTIEYSDNYTKTQYIDYKIIDIFDLPTNFNRVYGNVYFTLNKTKQSEENDTGR